jgi:hypothetical protein
MLNTNQFGYWGGKAHNDMPVIKSGWIGLDGGDGSVYDSPFGPSIKYQGYDRAAINRKYYLAQARQKEAPAQNVIKDTNISYNYSYGNSPTDRAAAERMRIENWELYVRTRWAIQDEYKRRRQEELSYLNRLERRVDALERAKDLNERYKTITGHNP